MTQQQDVAERPEVMLQNIRNSHVVPNHRLMSSFGQQINLKEEIVKQSRQGGRSQRSAVEEHA